MADNDSLKEVEDILLKDIRGAANSLHVGDMAEKKLRAERLNELLAAAIKTAELRRLLAERKGESVR